MTSVDGLLNDFNRELSAYLEDLTFDEGEFYRDRKTSGSDQWSESKIWTDIEEILAYQKQQKEKLEKLQQI